MTILNVKIQQKSPWSKILFQQIIIIIEETRKKSIQNYFEKLKIYNQSIKKLSKTGQN